MIGSLTDPFQEAKEPGPPALLEDRNASMVLKFRTQCPVLRNERVFQGGSLKLRRAGGERSEKGAACRAAAQNAATVRLRSSYDSCMQQAVTQDPKSSAPPACHDEVEHEGQSGSGAASRRRDDSTTFRRNTHMLSTSSHIESKSRSQVAPLT